MAGVQRAKQSEEAEENEVDFLSEDPVFFHMPQLEEVATEQQGTLI